MRLSPSSTSPIDHEGLARNPWIEPLNAPHSAVEGEASEESEHDARTFNGTTSHVRSHTTAGHPLHASLPHEANEQQDPFARGATVDLHETRPSLRRAITASAPGAAAGEESGIQKGRATPKRSSTLREADTEVIVHQIRPTDSLAGVALRYNISVAALRSTNKLWASDSIHLREVLYIPVHTVAAGTHKLVETTVRRRPAARPSLFHSAPDSYAHSPSHRQKSASESDTTGGSEIITHASAAYTVAAGSNSTIKRVPLSELSFFPPPSTSALLPSTRPNSRRMRPTSPSPPYLHPSRSITATSTLPRGSASASSFFSGTSGENLNGASTLGLTSFLHGAKEEIISRLSLDSMRASSDVSEDPEVEMDVVRPKAASNHQHSLVVSGRELDTGVTDLAQKSTPKAVRTVQLQPSPSMEIPVVSTVDKAVNETGAA